MPEKDGARRLVIRTHSQPLRPSCQSILQTVSCGIFISTVAAFIVIHTVAARFSAIAYVYRMPINLFELILTSALQIARNGGNPVLGVVVGKLCHFVSRI